MPEWRESESRQSFLDEGPLFLHINEAHPSKSLFFPTFLPFCIDFACLVSTASLCIEVLFQHVKP